MRASANPRCPTSRWRAARSRRRSNGEIEAAVAAVEARLIAKPDDGKGWAVIAPVYMRLERYAEAAHAYAEALRHSRRRPLAARRLRRGSGRRGRRRGHRRSATGVRSGADRSARPAAGALLSRARRRTGRQEGGRDPGLPSVARRLAARRALAEHGERAIWRRSRASPRPRRTPPPFPRRSGR